MDYEYYKTNVLSEFRRLKKLAEDSFAQLSDEDLFRSLDEESLSVALIVKHMSGNMRSRWRDFLTTDGEKPDRNRDTEFVIEADGSRAALLEKWEAGWKYLFDAIEPLSEVDFETTIHIRGEPHTVMQAINRQLTHYAYHVGQIVFLAKHYAGDNWKTLSVPKGKSEEFRADPEDYLKP